ncbi:MAG: methylenetetrahydrofolate reductase [Rhodospirillaceae bacterium]|nr:methylenetetrahydrofolate reductase [Rhodospirillaceae bacterium]
MAEARSQGGATVLPASIELSPRGIATDPASLRLIPPGTRTYIVDSGDTSVADWGDACLALARADLVPVPHIACRRLRSRAEIDDRLSAMVRTARISDALVIGGDIAKPAGPFASSMDLLATGLLERQGIRHIGVAGHPEGSPDIAPAAVVEALHWKIEFAARTGIDLRLVTQFNFDADGAVAWAERLRSEGIRVPIHLGVAGPTTMTRLMKYAALCGVRTSLSFALKRKAALTSLLGNYAPDPHVRAIETGVLANERSLIQQLHIYAFGGLPGSAEWLTGRGSWEPRSKS